MLKCLFRVLKDHGRQSMLYFLSSLPISVLRSLDTEANTMSHFKNAPLFRRPYFQTALTITKIFNEMQ